MFVFVELTDTLALVRHKRYNVLQSELDRNVKHMFSSVPDGGLNHMVI